MFKKIYTDISTGGKFIRKSDGRNMINGMYRWQQVKPVKLFGMTLFYTDVGVPFFDYSANFK